MAKEISLLFYDKHWARDRQHFTQIIVGKWFQVGGDGDGAVVHRLCVLLLFHRVLCEPKVFLHHLLERRILCFKFHVKQKLFQIHVEMRLYKKKDQLLLCPTEDAVVASSFFKL